MNKYNIWLLLVLVLTLIVSINLIKNSQKPACNKCNIIFITLDTLSANHLPCYGYERDTAPNLCKFAKDNVFFSKNYSASNWTLPSHFSTFTSLLPSIHNTVEIGDKLDPKFQTLTEILKENGYETIYFGVTNVKPVALVDGLGRGFNQIISNDGRKSIGEWKEKLNLLKENQKRGVPTFMFLHTFYVHDPYLTGRDHELLYTKYKDKYPEIPLTPEEFLIMNPKRAEFLIEFIKLGQNEGVSNSIGVEKDKEVELFNSVTSKLNEAKSMDDYKKILISLGNRLEKIYNRNWYIKYIGKDEPGDFEYAAALYDERINQLDEDLEEFLKEVSTMEDTIVVISGDHGESFGERKLLLHGNNLYNEEIKVPMIMKIPGVKNRQIDELSSNIDVFPTVLSLVGLKSPDYIKGSDMSGLILKRPWAKTNNSIIAERYERKEKVLIYDKWKLYLKNTNDPNLVELYDLENDPKEKENIAKSNPDKVASMMEIVESMMSQN